jgi:hypothetical protein
MPAYNSITLKGPFLKVYSNIMQKAGGMGIED